MLSSGCAVLFASCVERIRVLRIFLSMKHREHCRFVLSEWERLIHIISSCICLTNAHDATLCFACRYLEVMMLSLRN